MAEKEIPLTEEEELAILFPAPVECRIGTKDPDKFLVLHILPMDLDTCIRFGNAARPIVAKLIQAQAGDRLGGDLIDKMLPDLLAAASEHRVEFLDALALATNRKREFIGKLPWTAALALLPIIFTVNADFFVQSVGSLVPGAQAMAEESPPASAGAGRTH